MAAKSRRPLACTAEADAPVSSAVELHRSKNTPTQGRTKTLQGDVGHVQFGRERLHALVEDVRVRSDLADVLQSHARLRHEAVRLVEDVLAHHVHVLVLHHSTVNKTHTKSVRYLEKHIVQVVQRARVRVLDRDDGVLHRAALDALEQLFVARYRNQLHVGRHAATAAAAAEDRPRRVCKQVFGSTLSQRTVLALPVVIRVRQIIGRVGTTDLEADCHQSGRGRHFESCRSRMTKIRSATTRGACVLTFCSTTCRAGPLRPTGWWIVTG